MNFSAVDLPQFSLMQALQLVALFPCLFAIVLLVILNRSVKRIMLPILYFTALCVSFIVGLMPSLSHDLPLVYATLLWIESTQPALCFLLILQLWRGELPKAIYWLILALPLIGGSSLVYLSIELDEVCVWNKYCLEAFAFPMLYHIFSTSFIFLFLMVHLARIPIVNSTAHRYRSHRYWLMVSIVLLHTTQVAFELLLLADTISLQQYDIIQTVLRISFLYLVITSLFRVYDDASGAADKEAAARAKPIDQAMLDQIEHAMQTEQLYREMGFSRERFARKLNVPEHVLSRIINQHFGKNFNEFVNCFRVEEAKRRLVDETTSVTAIAFEVGFSSIASFNRVFKGVVSCSPTEYRAHNQGDKLSDKTG